MKTIVAAAITTAAITVTAIAACERAQDDTHQLPEYRPRQQS